MGIFKSWKGRAQELRSEVHALYLAFNNDRTPATAKAVIALIVAYAISPIDLIPDFIPGLGYLDEVVILPLGVAVALRLIPDQIMHDCREQTSKEFDAGPTRWIVAVIILPLWVLTGVMVFSTLMNKI